MNVVLENFPIYTQRLLVRGAEKHGRSLQDHIDAVLRDCASQYVDSGDIVDAFAGTSTKEEMLEARRLIAETEREEGEGSYDPSGQQRDRSHSGRKVGAGE